MEGFSIAKLRYIITTTEYTTTPEQLLGQQPDILVIITDQERYYTHWPADLRDQLMPSWSQLAARGLTFNRAYCSSAQCSPSRACMLTGEYSNINGVPEFPESGMPTIASLPNIATVLFGIHLFVLVTVITLGADAVEDASRKRSYRQSA